MEEDDASDEQGGGGFCFNFQMEDDEDSKEGNMEGGEHKNEESSLPLSCRPDESSSSPKRMDESVSCSTDDWKVLDASSIYRLLIVYLRADSRKNLDITLDEMEQILAQKKKQKGGQCKNERGDTDKKKGMIREKVLEWVGEKRKARWGFNFADWGGVASASNQSQSVDIVGPKEWLSAFSFAVAQCQPLKEEKYLGNGTDSRPRPLSPNPLTNANMGVSSSSSQASPSSFKSPIIALSHLLSELAGSIPNLHVIPGFSEANAGLLPSAILHASPKFVRFVIDTFKPDLETLKVPTYAPATSRNGGQAVSTTASPTSCSSVTLSEFLWRCDDPQYRYSQKMEGDYDDEGDGETPIFVVPSSERVVALVKIAEILNLRQPIPEWAKPVGAAADSSPSPVDRLKSGGSDDCTAGGDEKHKANTLMATKKKKKKQLCNGSVSNKVSSTFHDRTASILAAYPAKELPGEVEKECWKSLVGAREDQGHRAGGDLAAAFEVLHSALKRLDIRKGGSSSSSSSSPKGVNISPAAAAKRESGGGGGEEKTSTSHSASSSRSYSSKEASPHSSMLLSSSSSSPSSSSSSSSPLSSSSLLIEAAIWLWKWARANDDSSPSFSPPSSSSSSSSSSSCPPPYSKLLRFLDIVGTEVRPRAIEAIGNALNRTLSPAGEHVPYCGVCGRVANVHRCRLCNTTGYCCDDHWRLDREFHQNWCGSLRVAFERRREGRRGNEDRLAGEDEACGGGLKGEGGGGAGASDIIRLLATTNPCRTIDYPRSWFQVFDDKRGGTEGKKGNKQSISEIDKGDDMYHNRRADGGRKGRNKDDHTANPDDDDDDDDGDDDAKKERLKGKGAKEMNLDIKRLTRQEIEATEPLSFVLTVCECVRRVLLNVDDSSIVNNKEQPEEEIARAQRNLVGKEEARQQANNGGRGRGGGGGGGGGEGGRGCNTRKKSLCVHVVGAAGKEMNCPWRLVPRFIPKECLKDLRIILIGPELTPSERKAVAPSLSHDGDHGSSERRRGEGGVRTRLKVTVEAIQGLYHEQGMDLPRGHLIIAMNAGMHHYGSWTYTLTCILRSPLHLPCFVTAWNLTEAIVVRQILFDYGAKIIDGFDVQRNCFSSLLPKVAMDNHVTANFDNRYIIGVRGTPVKKMIEL